MKSKAMSLRLPKEDAADLAVIARAHKMHMSEVIRLALRQYIATLREDKNFQRRLKEVLDEDSEAIRRFAAK